MGRASCQPIRHNSFDHLYLSRVLPDPWWPKNRSSVSALLICGHRAPMQIMSPRILFVPASVAAQPAPAHSLPSIRVSPLRIRVHPCECCHRPAPASSALALQPLLIRFAPAHPWQPPLLFRGCRSSASSTVSQSQTLPRYC